MLSKVAAPLITLAVAAGAVYLFFFNAPSQQCAACLRTMHDATRYRLTLADGEQVSLCCPRCGLHFQEGKDVVSTEVADFPTGLLISAEEAFYVENSSVHLCCDSSVQRDRTGGQYQVSWDRCLPSLVAFKDWSQARRFMEENGGTIKLFDELSVE